MIKSYTMTPHDAGKYVNKTAKFIVGEVVRGRLAGIKIGRTYRIAPEDFEDYLARCLMPPWQSNGFQDLVGQQQFTFDDIDEHNGPAIDPQPFDVNSDMSESAP
jgi:excisionase family DNA binding protein